MSLTAGSQPPIRAVPMGLFPTMDSLDSVVRYSESRLPVIDRNEVRSLLFIYHNTLLKELSAQQS
ncbi:hypothetical protein [Xenophilus sp. Marseille-Q4582]|uniref:hypothetical protein n=1 Tax=Xenophilus sp. Marseille-Q4582 TaxID=2866600 RepID=UPI001CE4710E|nr:hypothetical protein [Xenophilus sp. Marseille-Q4582]